MYKEKIYVLVLGILFLFSGCSPIGVDVKDNFSEVISIEDNNNSNSSNSNEIISEIPEEIILKDDSMNYVTVDEFKKIVNSDFESLEITENGCFTFENYDEENYECYVEFVCDTDIECDKFDELYEDYLDKLDELDFSSEFEEIDFYEDGKSYGEEDETTTLSSYDISNGELINMVDSEVADEYKEMQANKEVHELMFKEFVRLIPTKYFDKNIFEFKVFTDGKDEILAYVSQTEDDENKWYLAIDIADYNPEDFKEFQYTLIHEYAHILTLNKEQVDYSVEEDSCNNYYSGEGCLKSSSYFEKYYNLFWKGANYGIDNVDYYSYENDFVTEYAATNPGEDIAESFTQFVLSKKPSDLSLIKDEKINFFYDFDELVDLRNSIRSQLVKTSRQRVQ